MASRALAVLLRYEAPEAPVHERRTGRHLAQRPMAERRGRVTMQCSGRPDGRPRSRHSPQLRRPDTTDRERLRSGVDRLSNGARTDPLSVDPVLRIVVTKARFQVGDGAFTRAGSCSPAPIVPVRTERIRPLGGCGRRHVDRCGRTAVAVLDCMPRGSMPRRAARQRQ